MTSAEPSLSVSALARRLSKSQTRVRLEAGDRRLEGMKVTFPLHVVLDGIRIGVDRDSGDFVSRSVRAVLRDGFFGKQIPIAYQRQVPGLILVPIRPVPTRQSIFGVIRCWTGRTVETVGTHHTCDA